MTRARLLGLSLWLLALVLLGWSLAQLPMRAFLQRVADLAALDLLVWILVNLAILFLGARRWQLLTQAAHCPLPLVSLFKLRQAGSTVSFLTPGPQFGGEPLQLYWLHRNCGLALHRAIAVLGMERFMETAVNFAVLLAGIALLIASALGPARDWLEAAVLLTVALAVLIGLAFLLINHPQWITDQLNRLSNRWSIDRLQGKEGYLALNQLLLDTVSQRKGLLARALGVSLVGWAGLFIELAVLLLALGLEPTMQQTVLIMVALRLALLLPIPGGLGTVEGAVIWSFELLGLPLAAAAGLIALMRLRDVAILLLGFVCMSKLGRPQPAVSEA